MQSYFILVLFFPASSGIVLAFVSSYLHFFFSFLFCCISNFYCLAWNLSLLGSNLCITQKSLLCSLRLLLLLRKMLLHLATMRRLKTKRIEMVNLFESILLCKCIFIKCIFQLETAFIEWSIDIIRIWEKDWIKCCESTNKHDQFVPTPFLCRTIPSLII